MHPKFFFANPEKFSSHPRNEDVPAFASCKQVWLTMAIAGGKSMCCVKISARSARQIVI